MKKIASGLHKTFSGNRHNFTLIELLVVSSKSSMPINIA